MSRVSMLIAMAACCTIFSGCLSGPGVYHGGPGLGYTHRGDCGGCGPDWQGRHLATGPVHAAHLARNRLLCGSGCGEAYLGEWRSHMPACDEPCDFDYTYNIGHRVGCGPSCNTCDPCCFSPPPRKFYRPVLTLLGRLYGERYCEGCDLYGDACTDCVGGYSHGFSSGDCPTGGCGNNYASRTMRSPRGQIAMNQSASQQPRMMGRTSGPQSVATQTPERVQVPEAPRRVTQQPTPSRMR
ncbi:MAG TPA: hypothetical protein PKD64_03710 [Pirellulaceae bacterium]|nr:hypothetical protein [Pirellulaceae bacterium]HMO91277.1 hypothetical protein [Pirellulaceae bacterium]HMP68539.1 hypothetical protein [Pirellulaceae bacterium]